MATKLQTKPTAAATVPVVVRTRTRPSVPKLVNASVGIGDLGITELARTIYIENKRMNAAKSAHDSARKSLLATMTNAGLDILEIETTNADNEPIKLVAEVTTPTVDFISVQKLQELVDPATFLKIVTATKKAVVENVGSIIAAEATRTGAGTTNVSVKPLSK